MIYLSEENREQVEDWVVSAMKSMHGIVKHTSVYNCQTRIEAAKALAELAKVFEDKPRYMFGDIGEKLMEDDGDETP